MSAEERVIEAARQGRLLAHRCSGCGLLGLSTAYFCSGCGGRGFEDVLLEGRGTVATYTIITVAPAGFEGHTPYAFVVLKLDGADLRISGFMGGVASPDDLPVGSPARISGFDERGMLMERL